MIHVPATVMLMRKISECELRITRAENIAAQQRAKSRNTALRADRATAAQLVASLEESIAWLKSERDRLLRELTRLTAAQAEAAAAHDPVAPPPADRARGSQTG